MANLPSRDNNALAKGQKRVEPKGRTTPAPAPSTPYVPGKTVFFEDSGSFVHPEPPPAKTGAQPSPVGRLQNHSAKWQDAMRKTGAFCFFTLAVITTDYLLEW